MSRSRPEHKDQYGINHRYGCTTPGWISNSPTIASVHIVRCAHCGAVALRPAQNNSAGNARHNKNEVGK